MRTKRIWSKVIISIVSILISGATILVGDGFADQCASFDVSTYVLHIPCFNIGGTSYWLDLGLIPPYQQLDLQLNVLGENGTPGDGTQCASFDEPLVTLHVPCLPLSNTNYWLDLGFASINPLILHITNLGARTSTIGVVLMHGKGGMPTSHPIEVLANALTAVNFIVITPEMPYSANRQYDKTYEDTAFEIDGYVADLQRLGAGKIFIAGQSLGANVAIYYATRATVDGVLAIGPGHTPELSGFQSQLGDSVARAKEMIAEGNGDQKANFLDVNQGIVSAIYTTANIYFSWYNPNGNAVMPKNAAAIKGGAALLWVVGTQDPKYQLGTAYAYDKAPSNPNNEYLVVNADHVETPIVAAPQIVQWLLTFGNQ